MQIKLFCYQFLYLDIFSAFFFPFPLICLFFQTRRNTTEIKHLEREGCILYTSFVHSINCENELGVELYQIKVIGMYFLLEYCFHSAQVIQQWLGKFGSREWDVIAW